MTPAELRAIIKNLDPGGQSKLARMLKVSPRTIRRWRAGKSRIPHAVELALRDSEVFLPKIPGESPPDSSS